jgi:Zn-dependent protease with chaperone function
VQILLHNELLTLKDFDRTDLPEYIVPFKECRLSALHDSVMIFLPENGTYVQVLHTDPSYQVLQSLSGEKSTWFGKLMQQKWYVLIGILLLVCTGFYFLLADLTPRLVVPMISVQQETSLGNSMYDALMITEQENSRETKIVQQFADRLKLSAQYKIQVTVLDKDEMNAFAVPGGHIVIYSGILNMVDGPESLAALLSHEATHINQRHTLKGLVSSMGVSAMISVVLGGIGDADNLLLRNAASLRQLSFSRSLEREADGKGMELMIENHIDPSGMKHLMELMQHTLQDKGKGVSFLSTHPLTEERIENAEHFLREHKSTTFAADSSLTQIWRALKRY